MYSLTKSLPVFLLCTIFVGLSTSIPLPIADRVCGLNEALRRECPICEATCAHPTPLCDNTNEDDDCYPQCQCLPGFVRSYSGECVRPLDCAPEPLPLVVAKREVTEMTREGNCTFPGCPAGWDCLETPVLCNTPPCPNSILKCIRRIYDRNADIRVRRQVIDINGVANPCANIHCPDGYGCAVEKINCPSASCKITTRCVDKERTEGTGDDTRDPIVVDHRSEETVIQN